MNINEQIRSKAKNTAHHICPGWRGYKRTSPKQSHEGQNLVELILTLPIVVVMLFFIIEMGRAWMAYGSAKLAAREAAYAAASHHDATAGQITLNSSLAAAGLSVQKATVSQVPNQHAYRANVIVTFTPFFGSMAIPTLSGPITLIPNEFDIAYYAVTDVAVY